MKLAQMRWLVSRRKTPTSGKQSRSFIYAMTDLKKSDWAGCDIGQRLMYSASEKLAIIHLVEDSELSIRRTLVEINVSRSSFYRWYRAYERDGQQTMLDAREIKSMDEIMLLNAAAAMVDGVYDMTHEKLRPGIRESDIVAEAINPVAGERCSPHPHNSTDRLIRPGDQTFFDIIQAYMGYRTCYYRAFNVGRATDSQRDVYKQAREWMDKSLELVRPGVGTDQIAKVFPKAEGFGFSSEMEAFALQFCHRLSVALHERPIISRLVSLDKP